MLPRRSRRQLRKACQNGWERVSYRISLFAWGSERVPAF
jgi:hypothetical protein